MGNFSRTISLLLGKRRLRIIGYIAVGILLYYSIVSFSFLIAISHDDIRAAKLLLTIGAQTDSPLYIMTRPIQVAVTHGNVEMVHLLLRHHANVNAAVNKNTPIYIAVSQYALSASHDENVKFKIITQLLIENGADINSRNGDFESTPLQIAVSNSQGDLGMVDLLITNGADINKGDGLVDGSPLFWAADYGITETARYLLSHGANPDKITLSGKSPLDIALASKHYEIVKLLKDYASH